MGYFDNQQATEESFNWSGWFMSGDLGRLDEKGCLEIEYPLTVLRYELVDGSGGAGRFRGGMGLRRVYRAEADCQLRVDGSRLLTPPWGLAGGHPGGRGAFRFSDGVEPFVSGQGMLRGGATVEIITSGAGGYGPPAERDAAAVERDFADGRIGTEIALSANSSWYHL